jgi:predicted Zn-dependent peptidase
MKKLLIVPIALAGLCFETCIQAAHIPNRPEQLQFSKLAFDPPNAADSRVVLKSGVVAYVIPDRELPLVNVSIMVRTGKYLEPAGKEGLADVTGYLLARGGIQSKTAEELEERTAFLAAQLNSGVDETMGTVSLNLLSKDLDEGFAILREVLSAPRFQEDKLALRKQQIIQALKQRNDESEAIEGREARRLAQGDAFWINRLETGASIESIQRADLETFHRKWFWPGNFIIAVNGDFDRAAMIAKLEQLCAAWPFKGEIAPSVPANPEFAKPGVYLVNKDVNQGRVTMMMPGIQRDNPDAYAITIMNDILGGGGFTSRIVNRVRSDEGLAYSAGSSFSGGVYYPGTFRGAFQSKSRTVAFACSIMMEEIKRIASEPVTEEELQTSKQGFLERFPRTFSSKGRVAGLFAQEEYTGRHAGNPDYYKNYRKHIEAVTQADVLRVAKKYLTPDKLVLLVVGQKSDLMAGDKDRPARLTDFGTITDVPLRDPLTLSPLSDSPKNN